MEPSLLPHLFRTEYSKITAVLCKLFGLAHIEIAEDIASDTFLQASETWSYKGLPENPVAWLYAVAKNKAKNYLKRDQLFQEKITRDLQSWLGRQSRMLGTFPRVADPSLILQTDAKGLRVQQAQIVFVHQDVVTASARTRPPTP